MSDIIGYSIITHYADKSTQTTKMSAAQAAALVSVAGKPASKANRINADECPIHGAWTPRERKDGSGWFWTCAVPKGEDWCKNKPSHEWEETHPAHRANAAPAPTESFDDLPF